MLNKNRVCCLLPVCQALYGKWKYKQITSITHILLSMIKISLMHLSQSLLPLSMWTAPSCQQLPTELCRQWPLNLQEVEWSCEHCESSHQYDSYTAAQPNQKNVGEEFGLGWNMKQLHDKKILQLRENCLVGGHGSLTFWAAPLSSPLSQIALEPEGSSSTSSLMSPGNRT